MLLRGIVTAAISVFLAACGGGGGGSSTTNTTSVTVTGSDTPLLEMSTIIGSDAKTAESKNVKFYLGGDLNTLAGKTIYLYVVIPIKGIYGSATLGYIDTVNKEVSVSFNSFQAPTLPVGVYEDKLDIKACLDSECTSQLAGSPYKLPFKFSVAEGITVSQSVVNMASAFGTLPQAVPMTFTLPAGSMNWGAGCGSNSQIGMEPVITKYSLSDQTKLSFTLEGSAVPTGSYTSTCAVSAYVPRIGSRVSKQFTVNYTVNESAVAAIFSPAEIVYSEPYAFSNFNLYATLTQTQDSGPLTLTAVEYLSEPAAHTDTSPLYRSWISNTVGTSYYAGNTVTVVTQLGTAGQAYGLPTGTYKARLKFQSGSGVSLKEVYLPVTIIRP